MTSGKHPSLADLLAWNDGEGDASAAADIAEHLRTCPACREELDQSLAITALLRQLPTMTIAPDDPGLARARALAYELPRRRRVSWQPVLLLAVALISVVLLVAANRPTSSNAGLGLNAVVRMLPRHSPERVPEQLGPPGESLPSVLGTVTPGVVFVADLIAPDALPYGLTRQGEINVRTSSIAELIYASDSGLSIHISQEVTDAEFTLNTTNSQTVIVHNTPVLMSADPDGSVSLTMWEFRGVRFTMLVLDMPSGGFTGAQSAEVVAALLNSVPTTQRNP